MAPFVGFDRIFHLSYTTKQNRVSSFAVVTKMAFLALLILCPGFDLEEREREKERFCL